MKVISFNIRHNTFLDVFPLWRKRYNKAVEFINKESPEVIGLQEITRKGKRYLEKHLDNYNVIGLSRHSIILTNEYNPLIIKKDYEIISNKTYSLSNDIYKLGIKDKHDRFPRICVIAHIKDKNNKYLIINTHIDNSSGPNKKRLLNIYKSIIEKEHEKDEYIILMGDYNMTLYNDDLKAFSKDYLDPFKDYKYGTFVDNPKLIPLDHIFLDKRLSYKNDLIYKSNNDEYYISDHYPIGVEIKVGD